MERKLESFPDARKIVVVPDKSTVPKTEIEVWDINDLKERAIQFIKSY